MLLFAALAVLLGGCLVAFGAIKTLHYLHEREVEREFRRAEVERILREHEDADAPGAGSNYTLNGAPEDP